MTNQNRRSQMIEVKQKEKLSLREIGERFGVSGARVGQIIGPIGHIRPVKNHLLSVYRWIENYISINGFSPTVSEIGNHFKNRNGKPTSSSVVHYWLDRMENLALIAPRPYRQARTIVLYELDKKNPIHRDLLKIEKSKIEETNHVTITD